MTLSFLVAIVITCEKREKNGKTTQNEKRVQKVHKNRKNYCKNRRNVS